MRYQKEWKRKWCVCVADILCWRMHFFSVWHFELFKIVNDVSVWLNLDFLFACYSSCDPCMPQLKWKKKKSNKKDLENIIKLMSNHQLVQHYSRNIILTKLKRRTFGLVQEKNYLGSLCVIFEVQGLIYYCMFMLFIPCIN